MGNLLIGSYKAKLDKGGRLKIPEKFRTAMEEKFGKELFVTSLEDDFVQIFPLPVWEDMMKTPSDETRYPDPDIQEFVRKASLLGAHGEVDTKGRVLITQWLREKAGLQAEVQVIGLNNYLEVWDRSRLDEKMAKKPLTYEDFKKISKLMSDRKPE
jgi:division/cell wall cluster transcriptional repressor MraZ